MKITVFGSGREGLVQAAVLAGVGHQVICMDPDAHRIDCLRDVELPFFEPGLEHLLRDVLQQQLLSFTADTKAAVQGSDYLFICADPVTAQDGSIDTDNVLQLADSIARYMTSRKVVINRCSAPVGTTERLYRLIREALAAQGREIALELVANPALLSSGTAIADCQQPNRIIIGTTSMKVVAEMRRMYHAFNRGRDNIMIMDATSAELSKYAANAMLATRVSLMNEMAAIAEAVHADIDQVRRGIGADERIGSRYLYPGCGYGGASLARDVRALKQLAGQHGYRTDILTSVLDTNQRQKNKLAERVMARFGSELAKLTIAVWGLAFKPGTDDMREAPSRYLVEGIWSYGGKVRAYDPQAHHTCRALYGERDDLFLAESKEQALEGADVLVICTEWKAFWSPDFDQIKALLSQAIIFDGRNLYNPALMEALGIEYYGVGRGRSLSAAA